MNIKYLYITLLLVLSLHVFAQNGVRHCATVEKTDEEIELLPWYGNNQYLSKIKEEVKIKMEKGEEDKSAKNLECKEFENTLFILIKFWIYRESETEAGLPDADDLQNMIDAVNQLYQSNGMDVQFLMVCPQFITDEDAVVMNGWESFWNDFGQSNHDDFVINIHLIRDYTEAAGVYFSVGDFIVVERNVYSNIPDGTTTLAHEIGHYLGLDHPHRNSDKNKCRQEAVDRTRTFSWIQLFTCGKFGTICEKNGDALCDTPADPRLLGNVDNMCNYTASETDNWGDAYVPNTRNIMSLTRRNCRDWFSEGQINVMWYNILYKNNREFILTIDGSYLDPDQYEPDDSSFRGVPRVISLGEKQCHSFHNIQVSECIDEVDWLRIDNSNQLIGRYIIEINEVDGFTNPVEDVKVWHTDGNGNRSDEIITTNSTDGTTQLFEIPISCSDLMDDFLIEVIRTEDEEEGMYTILLNSSFGIPVINGELSVCIGDDFTVDNIPSEAEVEWAASPSLTINTTGSTVTVTEGIPSNLYWIEAFITYQGCFYSIRKGFDNFGGLTLPSIGDIFMEVSEEKPCDPEFIFSISSVQGATNYEWFCSSNSSQFNGCFGSNGTFAYADAFLEQGEGLNIEVTVIVTNECGASSSRTMRFDYEADKDCTDYFKEDGEGKRQILVIPNPVISSEVTVEIIDSLTEFTTYRIIISDQLGDIKLDNETIHKINQFNISSLPNGIYAIHVILDEEIISKSFIIQR